MNRTYPQHLVPTNNLPLIVSSQLDKSHYLGKFSEPGKTLMDSDGKLSPEAINIKRIPGFSCNKIPDSVPTDLYIDFVKEGSDKYLSEWQTGIDGVMPPKESFNLISNRGLYFIPIKDVFDFTDKYVKAGKGGPSALEFKLKVCHKPLLSNYWHFEFEVIADGHHMPDYDKSKSWQKQICSSIMSRVQDVAVFHI